MLSIEEGRETRPLRKKTYFYLTFKMAYDTIKGINGAWRSPEARLNGVQEVAGSNPVAPISDMQFGLSVLQLAPRDKQQRKGES